MWLPTWICLTFYYFWTVTKVIWINSYCITYYIKPAPQSIKQIFIWNSTELLGKLLRVTHMKASSRQIPSWGTDTQPKTAVNSPAAWH